MLSERCPLELQPLTKIPSSKSVQLVPVLSDDCIHAICESCYNLLRNTYGLDKKKLRSVKRKLSQSKNDVRSLAKPNTSLLKKRKLLMKELLFICITERPFQFDGQAYIQADEVSMGSLLGPTFADFYSQP